MKILIVDDAYSVRKYLKNLLLEIGYDDIEEAEDGEEALKKMHGIELVITDWNMPKVDGLTFVKTIRDQKSFEKIPVIMLTTNNQKHEVIEAIMSGIDNYIIKPFDKEILKSKIDLVLSRKN